MIIVDRMRIIRPRRIILTVFKLEPFHSFNISPHILLKIMIKAIWILQLAKS